MEFNLTINYFFVVLISYIFIYEALRWLFSVFERVNVGPNDTALFSLVIPNPGTELRDMVLEEGEATNKSFSDYSITAVNSNASQVDPKILVQLQKKAYRQFYFNPKRAWRIFQTTRSKRVLFSKVLFFLSKLTSPQKFTGTEARLIT